MENTLAQLPEAAKTIQKDVTETKETMAQVETDQYPSSKMSTALGSGSIEFTARGAEKRTGSEQKTKTKENDGIESTNKDKVSTLCIHSLHCSTGSRHRSDRQKRVLSAGRKAMSKHQNRRQQRQGQEKTAGYRVRRLC